MHDHRFVERTILLKCRDLEQAVKRANKVKGKDRGCVEIAYYPRRASASAGYDEFSKGTYEVSLVKVIKP